MLPKLGEAGCQRGSHVAWGTFSNAFRGIGGYLSLIFFPVFLLYVMYGLQDGS